MKACQVSMQNKTFYLFKFLHLYLSFHTKKLWLNYTLQFNQCAKEGSKSEGGKEGRKEGRKRTLGKEEKKRGTRAAFGKLRKGRTCCCSQF